MKFDVKIARKLDDVAKWAQAERGRIQLIAVEVNKRLEKPIHRRSVDKWLRSESRSRSEPRLSSGLALLEVFESHSKKEKRAVAGSARK